MLQRRARDSSVPKTGSVPNVGMLTGLGGPHVTSVMLPKLWRLKKEQVLGEASMKEKM